MTKQAKFIAVALSVLLAAAADAQFVQYTPPGSLANPQIPTKERLEAAMKEARWKWGPLSLAPWYGLKDMGYVNNVYGSTTEPVSSYTATIGVGLHGYLHPGSKTVIGVHALPEYVWWNNLPDRRAWNGDYGVGLFSYWNRLTLEATGNTSRRQEWLSAEFEQPVNLVTDKASATLDLRLFGKISVVAAGSQTRYRYRSQDVPGPRGEELLLLDRDERQVRAGLRYNFNTTNRVGLGVVDLSTEFIRPGRDRSSSGTSPVIEVALAGAKLNLSANVILADLAPEPGSQFLSFDRPLGSATLRYKLTGALTPSLYANRNIAYSIGVTGPYYQDERAGVSLERELGWRSRVRVYAERGRLVYPDGAHLGGGLSSTTKYYGADLNVKLGYGLLMIAQASNSEYDLEGGGGTSVTRVQVSLRTADLASKWW